MDSSTSNTTNQGADAKLQQGDLQQQSGLQQQHQQQHQHQNLSQEDKQKLKAQIDKNVGTAPIKLDFIDYSKVHLLYGIENIASSTQPTEGATENSTSNTQPPPQESSEGAVGDDNSSEPPSKRSKKRNRGQNKKRPFREKRAPASVRLCPRLTSSEACQYGDKCIFSHDIAKIVKEKPADIGSVCYNFNTYGKCQRGIMCRYGSAHITADYKNVIDEEKWNSCKDKSVTTNILSKDVQNLLRKRKMKHVKTDKYLATLPKIIKERRERQKHQEALSQHLDSGKKESSNLSTECAKQEETKLPKSTEAAAEVGLQNDLTSDSKQESNDKNAQELSTEKADCTGEDASQSEPAYHKPPASIDQSEVVNSGQDTGCQSNKTPCQQDSSIQHSGVVTDEDLIKLKSGEKKTVDFRDKLYLAPLTTVGNLPFRRICKGFGADITCGEMAICTNLLQGQASEWALLKRHSSEDVFGVQIAGAFPDTMTKCAELLNDNIDMDFMDINVGCPIDIVYNKGAGCGLMNRIGKFEDIVRGMNTVLDVPVTVKMRTGVYDKHLVAVKMIPKIYNWGASVVTLHGRTREQRYTKSADWDYIKQCVDVADPYPLLGNGDILSYEDANLFKEKSGVAGMMIARGALIKPWIFTEIKEQRHWDISAQERFDYLKTYINYGLEHWGSDTEGVEKTRRFLLEWLSFLYRYIPVGILERLPQHINQRPPHYVGRNDLETLMASANYADWIKISEMLLGPVPDNFQFLPKHKANSYS